MSNKGDSSDDDQLPGAACAELLLNHNNTNKENEYPLPPIGELSRNPSQNSSNNLRQSPRGYSNNASILSDIERLQNQNLRRHSNFPMNNTYSNSTIRRPSMPSILVSTDHETIDFQKMMLLSSRRSSMESAYHSHASNTQSPRNSLTPNNFDNTSTLDSFDHFHQSNSPSFMDEFGQQMATQRRDSLSYEAIREYFLENNPYQNDQYLNNGYLCHHDNNDENTYCPLCYRRRSSWFRQPSHQFRTPSHRAVVESQFEELFDIPDIRSSRAPSIDLFSGIDIEHLRRLTETFEATISSNQDNVDDCESDTTENGES